MKNNSKIYLTVTILLALAIIYIVYFAYGGADGLSNFFPLIALSIMLASFGVAFVVSVLPNTKGGQFASKVVIALPILGFLSVIGIFGYFSLDYTSSFKEQIELEKKHIQTQTYSAPELELSFNHVSGHMVGMMGDTPTIIPISPKVSKDTLYVPVDDEAYAAPDIFYWKKTEESNNLLHILQNCKHKKVFTSAFPNLSKNTAVYKLNMFGLNDDCKGKIIEQWLSKDIDIPEIVYIIKPSTTTEKYGVLLIYSEIQSAAALVENMGINDVEDYNKWYHSLRFTK